MGKLTGEFELQLLTALLRLKENAYGMTIHKEIENCMNKKVAIGAIYTSLDRLEKKGFVDSYQAAGTAPRAGRPRRFFKITAEGHRAAHDAKQRHERMWRGLEAPEYA